MKDAWIGPTTKLVVALLLILLVVIWLGLAACARVWEMTLANPLEESVGG